MLEGVGTDIQSPSGLIASATGHPAPPVGLFQAREGPRFHSQAHRGLHDAWFASWGVRSKWARKGSGTGSRSYTIFYILHLPHVFRLHFALESSPGRADAQALVLGAGEARTEPVPPPGHLL